MNSEGKNMKKMGHYITHPGAKDLIFMNVIWTTELFKTLFLVYETRLTYELFVAKDEENLYRLAVKLTIAICVLMAAMAVASYYFKKRRLMLLIGGFVIYLLVPVFGLLYALERDPVYGIVLIASSCIWWVVHPIRFLLIFHQFYPIQMLNARQIVTGNMLAIWITEYFSSVIMYDEKVEEKTFVNGWSISGVGLFLWIIGLIFISRFQNKKPDKLQTVAEEYHITEVAQRFDRRQKKSHILLFVLLLVPYLIFPILKTSMHIVRWLITTVQLQNRYKKYDPLVYRLDLIITIVVAILLEIVSIFLRKRRNEKFEMFVIAVVLALNIVFLLVFRPTLHDINDLDINDFNLKDVAQVHLLGFPLDNSNPDIFLRVKEIVSAVYKEEEDYDSGPWSNMLIHVPALDEETVPLQVVSSLSGKVLFEQEIKIYRDEVMVYMYYYEGANSPSKPNFEGKLVLLDIDIWDRSAEDKFYFVFWNANMPECHDGYDDLGIESLNNSETWTWEGSYSVLVDIREPGGAEPSMICFPFKPTLFYPISKGIEDATAKFPLIFPREKGKAGANEITCSGTEKGNLCVPEYGIDFNNKLYGFALNDQWLATTDAHTPELCQIAVLTYTGPDYPASYIVWYWNIEQSVELGIPVCFARPIYLVHEGRTKPIFSTPILNSIVYGLTSFGIVSYIVLLWILSPINWRPFVLFGFFFYEVLCERLVKLLVTGMTEQVWGVLLGVAVFAFAAHLAVWFVFIWKVKIPDEEKSDPNKRY